jgi:hypothetical protein
MSMVMVRLIARVSVMEEESFFTAGSFAMDFPLVFKLCVITAIAAGV